MAKLYNLARMSTATTGTGTITLGSAVSGFLTFAQSGVANAEVVSYGIRDGANSEVGTGTYTTAGTTLTRTVSKSTNSDSAISLSGTAEVYITATKEDIANLREANSFTDTTASTSSTTGAMVVAGGVGVAGNANLAGTTVAGYTGGAITTDKFQIVHTDVGSGGHASYLQYGANVNPIKMIFYKTRNASPASHTVVTSSDSFFNFDVRASDGDEYIQAALLSATADGTPSNNVMPSRWNFYTTATNTLVERLRIDSSGHVVIGGTAAIAPLSITAALQVLGASGDTSSQLLATFQANTNSAQWTLAKSRHATLGSHTIVNANDDVGLVRFVASNGTSWDQGAYILASVDGTPGASNDMPMRMAFHTAPDGSTTPAERLRVTSAGRLIATTSGQVAHFWVYWTANSTTILASHNVASIDDDAAGDAGVNLTTAFSSANYAAFVTTNDATAAGWDADSIQSSGINLHTASAVDVLCGNMIDGTTAVGTLVDPQQWQCVGFGVSA